MENVDPLMFCKVCWPRVGLYDKQRETVRSLCDNDETIVVAGNELGKDFVAGFLALWFFMAHKEVRIVTTSVKDDHLDILWGEIGRFIDTCEYPLDFRNGGSLIVNHRHIRKIVNGQLCKISYLKGMVSAKGEGMAGHHAAHTLLVIDEASGVDDKVYNIASIWADRVLIFGNPNPCNNFFIKGVKAGNLSAEGNGRLYRNVIKIRAQDSPNVQLGELQKRNGKQPTNEVLVPGLITHRDYCKRRIVFDKVRQCISLDAEFYEGAEVLMFPPEWLNLAERRAEELGGRHRKAKTIGVDPAEGGDSTVMVAIDDFGLIELISKKTPDTSIVTGEVLAFAKKHGVDAKNILFDAGGGGKQHADRLRAQGHRVRVIRFGGSPTAEKRRGVVTIKQRKEEEEVQYVYTNRRVEMYWLLHLLLDPSDGKMFGIPAEYVELRRQLAPIPRLTDGEGRLVLPPKNKPASKTGAESKVVTMTELIGCSPDEADAVVLAVFGLQDRRAKRGFGVAF